MDPNINTTPRNDELDQDPNHPTRPPPTLPASIPLGQSLKRSSHSVSGSSSSLTPPPPRSDLPLTTVQLPRLRSILPASAREVVNQTRETLGEHRAPSSGGPVATSSQSNGTPSKQLPLTTKASSSSASSSSLPPQSAANVSREEYLTPEAYRTGYLSALQQAPSAESFGKGKQKAGKVLEEKEEGVLRDLKRERTSTSPVLELPTSLDVDELEVTGEPAPPTTTETEAGEPSEKDASTMQGSGMPFNTMGGNNPYGYTENQQMILGPSMGYVSTGYISSEPATNQEYGSMDLGNGSNYIPSPQGQTIYSSRPAAPLRQHSLLSNHGHGEPGELRISMYKSPDDIDSLSDSSHDQSHSPENHPNKGKGKGKGGKRKASGGGAAGGREAGLTASGKPRKKKKPRIALSCRECTRRKQKCDRQTPCHHCISRKVQHLCVPYIPGESLSTPSTPAAPNQSSSNPSSQYMVSRPIDYASSPQGDVHMESTSPTYQQSPFGISQPYQQSSRPSSLTSPAMYSPGMAQGQTHNGDMIAQSPSTGSSTWPTRNTPNESNARQQAYPSYTNALASGSNTTYAPPGTMSSVGPPSTTTSSNNHNGNGAMLPPPGPTGFPLPIGAPSGVNDAAAMINQRLLPFMSGPAPGMTGSQDSGVPWDEALQRLARVEDALGLRSSNQNALPAPRPIKVLPDETESGSGSGHYGPNSADGSMTFRVDRDIISRSTSAGEGTTVDAGRWFATQNSVPNIEALREGNAPISLNLTDCGTPSENLARLIKECGVSPTKLMELVQELPEYSFASKLVDYFFESLNYVRYPIHEHSFRRSFENVYERREKRKDLEPGNVRILPLVFIVLATASRMAPEEWAGDDRTRRLNSLKMYWCSRRSILIATAIQPESLELVVTRLLSGLYLVLIHDRRLTESWSQLGASLRTAQAIGLHRDGAKLGLDSFQTEYRRRIWSFLYHADKNYSLILGRPPSISDSYCDAQDPSNVELDDIIPGKPIVSKPLSEPTSATFLILRKRFAKITGKITHHFQQLHEPAKYEDVQALDNELKKFMDDLPPHFRMENADKSLDETFKFLPVHRYYIRTEILFIVITLHRPWLLRKLKSDRYALSRKACFNAAKQDFKIRQAFRRDFNGGTNSAYVGGQFREFNAAMIAGIAAIIFPTAEDAPTMRMILQKFLEQPRGVLRQITKDSTSQTEVAIIRTLNRRAVEVLEKTSATNAASHQSESVALLLSMRERDAEIGTPGSANYTARLGAGGVSEPAGLRGIVYTTDNSAISNFNKIYETMVEDRDKGITTGEPSASGQPLKTVPAPKSAITPVADRPSSSAGVNHSPVSTENEDERPQQLLDHWLSTNSSLNVGHQGGMLDGLLPFNSFDPTLAMATDNSWMADGDFSGANWTGGLDLENKSPFPSAGFGLGGIPQMQSMASGSSGIVAPEDPNVLMDDSYWNALIDGILNNTTG